MKSMMYLIRPKWNGFIAHPYKITVESRDPMCYYALVDRTTDEIVDVFVESSDVRNAYLSRNDKENMLVIPLISNYEYTRMSKDFSGEIAGIPYILYLDAFSGATLYGPVRLINDKYEPWASLLRSRGAKIRSIACLQAIDSGFVKPISIDLMAAVYEYWINDVPSNKLHEVVSLDSIDIELIETYFPPKFQGELFEQWSSYYESKHTPLGVSLWE